MHDVGYSRASGGLPTLAGLSVVHHTLAYGQPHSGTYGTSRDTKQPREAHTLPQTADQRDRVLSVVSVQTR